MSDPVTASYDANAELYASLFLNALDDDHQATKWLRTFAELTKGHDGPVFDLGCGPGYVVHHLTGLEVNNVVGFDLSSGQIEQARKAFPDLSFHVGDITALEASDASCGGVVSRYSVIHLPPAALAGAFNEWLRLLEPGAPLFLSFFGSKSPETHGTPFDHTVATAYELDAETISQQLQSTGFINVQIESSPIPEGGRPFDDVTILARKPSPTPGG